MKIRLVLIVLAAGAALFALAAATNSTDGVKQAEGKPAIQAMSVLVFAPDYEPRSGAGMQQLAILNDEYFVGLQRIPSGKLDLVPVPMVRF